MISYLVSCVISISISNPRDLVQSIYRQSRELIDSLIISKMALPVFGVC